MVSLRPAAQHGDAARLNTSSAKKTLFISENALRSIAGPKLPARSIKIPEVFDNPIDDFRQLHFGLVSDQFPHLRQIRHTAGHVLEARLIRFVVRDEYNLRLAAG